MKVKFIKIIILALFAITGCASVSVVESSSRFFDEINFDSMKMPYDVGIVINDEFRKESVRSIVQKELLKYEFEFKLGEDFSQTLPPYLERLFNNVAVLDNVNNESDIDIILIPEVSSSKLITWIRFSAGPSYELVINLKMTIIKDGKIHKILNVVESSKKDIPAFSNTKKLRTQLMKSDYEKLMAKIYSKLKISLQESL